MAIENGQYPRYRINTTDETRVDVQDAPGQRWQLHRFYPTGRHAQLACDKLNMHGETPLFTEEDLRGPSDVADYLTEVGLELMSQEGGGDDDQS